MFKVFKRLFHRKSQYEIEAERYEFLRKVAVEHNVIIIISTQKL